MYEAVHATPDGESTVSRFASTLTGCGYDGLVVRNHSDARTDVPTVEGVDIIPGIEIRADSPQHASGYLGSYREEYPVLLVHGGSAGMNRFACEHDRVDVLAHPLSGDGGIDHVLAKAAAANGVRLEVSLAPVLRSNGGRRVRAIRELRRLWKLIEKFDVPYVVSADPTSHLEVRAPRELAALGAVVGIPAEDIRAGLAEWGVLADQNRERLDDAFVEPGVRRGGWEP